MNSYSRGDGPLSANQVIRGRHSDAAAFGRLLAVGFAHSQHQKLPFGFRPIADIHRNIGTLCRFEPNRAQPLLAPTSPCGSVAHETCGGVMDEVPPILVVEDEPLVRLTIVEALQDGGYSVLEAAEGNSALAEIERVDELRGLVTDIRMGATPSGWEVAQQAREKFPALAVVYVTGDSITEWPSNGVPQSAVLQKPFASAELVAALANLLVAQQSTPPQS